ncbi:site-2 protease family protein [Paenibacillus brasilensis]|uniref:Peptidase M50 domain-containing protein n=1 Tax=Paenibacillus brasilensis TaxID=128574 RepID=A0ABU0L765_9BACL|nr:site-2 protease family protein [Paenibacillus brasilensis]MDQ0497132.1 hypothetical protein [Paenibacillus brasilensis]
MLLLSTKKLHFYVEFLSCFGVKMWIGKLAILMLFGMGFCLLLNFYQVQTADMMGAFGTFSGVGMSLILLLLSILFHEFGHVVAAYRYGIRPRDIGIGLYMLVPVMFVDLSEAWKLPRKQRVVIDFAGIYF